MNEREEIEKNLIDVGKFDRHEVSNFSLEELRNFWVMYLFETRKQQDFSESGKRKQESSAPKVDDYA